MSALDMLSCLLFDHRYQTYEFRSYARLVRCVCCDKRWVMSDNHRAFLRYDNDPIFKSDLLEMYPELQGMDI